MTSCLVLVKFLLWVSCTRYSVMKAVYYTFIFASLFLLSCEGERINPAQESFEFYEGAKVKGEFPYAENGQKVVFHHYYMAADHENIADDEYAEEVFFEVDPREEFYLEDEALKKIDFVFRQYCYCPTFDQLEIVNGYLKGEKKGGDRYLLEANIELNGYYIFEGDTLEKQVLHSAFTGLFKRAELPAAE